MERVSSGIVLEALLDGTTLTCSLRNGGSYPLLQRYNADNGRFVPDFTTLSSDVLPVLYPLIVMNDGTGQTAPKTCVWTYNGTVLTFASKTAGDGRVRKMSTNAGLVDVFELVDDYTFQYNSATAHSVGLRIWGNLASSGNRDSDMIGCSGTVEIDGQVIDFSGLSKEFVIEESAGNEFSLWLTATNEGQITDANHDVTITAHCDISGDLVEDAIDGDNYYVNWKSLTADGIYDDIEGAVGASALTDNSIKISQQHVDNLLTVCAELFNKAGDLLATGYIEIADMTDPLEVSFSVKAKSGSSGTVTGYQLKKGGIAIVTASVVKRSDGSVQSGYGFKFATYNNAGAPFTLAGQTLSSGFSGTASVDPVGASVDVTFDDVYRAGRHLKLYATATKS